MSYLNISVRQLIMDRVGRDTFLPAIQREYVWSPYQVEMLFDSLLNGYPINSFLFWKIREEHKNDWTSYDFIRDYDAEKPHNTETNLNGVNKDIYLVLDGQQRITSLYIGLLGSYRFFYRKWRKCKLYLNLLKAPGVFNPQERSYDFYFKEDANPWPGSTEPQLWYEVGRILSFDDAEDAKDDIKNELAGLTQEQQDCAKRIIGKLHGRLNSASIINYYEETSNDYDKVLEIFVRTNTGGKKLEYSDILLSTATAKWRKLNAREEINNFTDEINKIGTGYSFGKDFVMKAAMYLTEDLPIQYKVSSFTRENLEKIEDHWETTKDAVRDTVKLVSRFGFTDKNLVTKLALLPIAQYIRNKNTSTYISSSAENDVKDQNNIQKWLLMAILKNLLGGSSDTTLNQMREVVGKVGEKYPVMELSDKLKVDLSFTDIELDKLLSYNYGTRYSYLILSLIYPGRDWKDKTFNEDHIYPQASFRTKDLRKRGLTDEAIEQYQSVYNSIANLELLEDSENKSKNATPFDEWIKSRDANFKARHLIPEMEDYGYDHFMEFIEARKKLIKAAIKKAAFEEVGENEEEIDSMNDD